MTQASADSPCQKTPGHVRSPGKELAAEGLRGVAALCVFLSHMVISFYPAAFSIMKPGTQAVTLDGVETALVWAVLPAFWNGHFAVCIFFVLSGFVLARPAYTGEGLNVLSTRFLRRYVRLSVPIAASVLLAWALMALHAAANQQAALVTGSEWLISYWGFEPNMLDALRDGLYRTIFWGDAKYNPPLWTMRVEFIGSLLIFAFYALVPWSNGRIRWRHMLVFPFLVLPLFRAEAVFYMAFFGGSVLWMLPRLPAAGRGGGFALGVFLGAYHSGWVYDTLPVLPYFSAQSMYNVLGAWMMLYAVHSGFLQGVFSCRPLVLLGRISFSLYLIHFFVILCLATRLYLAWLPSLGHHGAVLASGFASLVVLLLASAMFERLFDRTGIALSRRLA